VATTSAGNGSPPLSKVNFWDTYALCSVLAEQVQYHASAAVSRDQTDCRERAQRECGALDMTLKAGETPDM